MHEAVDDVIARRRVDQGGLGRTMSTSMAIHFGLVILLFVLPKDWLIKEPTKPLLMTISLGGSPGEKSGGMVSAGARPVEQVAPPPKRPEPIPPATPPKPSNIVVPVKAPPKTPPAPTENLTPTTVTRPPTTGAQVTAGTSSAETGMKGMNTGLQSGGGTGGATAQVDPDFCCPEYIAEVVRRITTKWPSNQADTGEVVLVFEIMKDGTFTTPTFEKRSSFVPLNIASTSAFEGLRLPPLPARYQADRLKVHMLFPYKR